VAGPATTRTIRQLPIDHVHPAPDNPRLLDGGTLGDLTELSSSMQTHGVLQPLLVRPESDGSYLIVYGHRRHAAAIQAGLTEIPAEVRDLDDATRRELMIIENLHREDLTPMQEAHGYRQALANNPNLTQRELARRVGKSQPHISKYLKLLDLTPTAQAAVDAGKISLTDAHDHLVKLKDDPARMDAVVDRPFNIQGAVDRELREKQQAAKRAKAEQQLRDVGVTVVTGPSRYGSWREVEAKPLAGQGLYGYGTDEVRVDAQAHASEECHAAVVREEGDVILVCTAHKRHRRGGDSQVKTGLTEEQKAERRATIKRNRAAREARDTRNAFLVRQLKKRIPLGELAPQLALQFLHHADGRTLEIACDLIQQATGEKLLGKQSAYWTDYRSLLFAYAERDPDALLRVGAALMFAAP
jgi:ParB family chromosome partitioning protein